MKNLFISILFGLALLSCQKNDHVLSLEQSSVSLHSGDNFTIKALGFDNCSFTSEDEYVAKVSASGVVSAQRVGKTNIIVKAENQVASLQVDVEPVYNFFTEPVVKWGMTKSQLISLLGTPDSVTDSGVGYVSTSTIAPLSLYLFDNNGLYSSAVLIKSSYSSSLGAFMAERYLPVSIDMDNYTFCFVNALTLQSATTFIGLKLYNISYWMSAYFAKTYLTKSGVPENNYDTGDKVNELVGKAID